MTWPTKKLGEVCEIVSPGIKKFKGAKKYVATADVEFNKITNSTEVTYNNRPSRANMETKENDVLVAKMAETKKFLVADRKLQEGYIFSTGFAVLRTKKDLLPKYLFYFLTTRDFNLQKDKLAVGATQKAINNPALKRIKIPLPPLPIQQKIVKRLDAIKKAQELNEKQIELADELFQNLLHRELNPKGKNWEMVRLGKVTKIFGGYAFKSSKLVDKKPPNDYLPVIKIANVLKNGNLDVNNIQYHKFSEDLTEFLIKKNDILVAMTGATVGKVASSAYNNLLLNQRVGSIKVKEDVANQKFLQFLLLSEKFYRYCQYTAGGGAQGNISPSQIMKYRIPLLPLETQRKIVEKLSAVQDYKKKLLEQKQKLQELFESVLHKSMKGELIKQ